MVVYEREAGRNGDSRSVGAEGPLDGAGRSIRTNALCRHPSEL